MTSGNSKNHARNRSGRGVRAPYTFENLKDDLWGMYRPKDRQNSLRAISRKYGVSHAVIQRVLAGIEPKHPDIRKAFKLTNMQPTPVCPKHGIVHKGKCPRKKTFAENAADYAAWKRENEKKLDEIVKEIENMRSRTE